MELGKLRPPKGSVKNTKRKGRGPGSGLGKTAGRGHKGAGQRSGNKKRPWFEGGQMALARRLPKRGFSNHIFKKNFQIINISDITRLNIKDVNPDILVKKRLVKSLKFPIKVLGKGKIDSPINLKIHTISRSAKQEIEKAGGSVEELC